ncbi:hypothetical protein JCM11251_003502 [Rhodosporidiobolus azoricus]
MNIARSPPSTRFSPTFSSLSHYGGTSSIPAFGRKAGMEGYVDEKGTSLIGPPGEGKGEVVGSQLAWRMKALDLQDKNGLVAVAPASTANTSLPSLFPPAATPLRSSSCGAVAVAQWRSALKEAHRTPTPTRPGSPLLPSLELPDRLYSAPPVFPCPSSCDVPPEQSLVQGPIPLARPADQIVHLANDFSLHHNDLVNPASLPLPDVPTDYIFPDSNGRASFSREPFSPPAFHPAGAERDLPTIPPTEPASPPLQALEVLPSPPSVFSSVPSPNAPSALPPPASAFASLQPPQLGNTESPDPESLTERDDKSRRESLERDGSATEVATYEEEAAKAFQAEVEGEKRVRENLFAQAVEPLAREYGIETPLLLLPSSIASHAHCPVCGIALSAPDTAHTWVDKHWSCIPRLRPGVDGAGAGGVRVVVLDGKR